MCAQDVPDVCTYLKVLTTQKYGPRAFQRRIARLSTIKARSCGSISNLTRNHNFSEKMFFHPENQFFKIFIRFPFEPQERVFELRNSYGAHSKGLGPL